MHQTDNHTFPGQRTLAVVGLGYVGLPLALLAARKDWTVIGIDNDSAKVALINKGTSPLQDKELSANLSTKPITATTDPRAVAKAQIIVICVPTPVTDHHKPDFGPLRSALESIRPHIRSGQVLIIESTINPGVMDEFVVPLLQKRADLKLDSPNNQSDVLFLAHCPERINPGDAKWSVVNIPRVLGGYSKTGVAKATEFYESIIEAPITAMTSVTEAEAVKILENTFRDINIAFINEMAQSFAKLGIDIKNVIAGAATKPFAFMPHYPGNGVGGHCISVDPYYMIERAKKSGFDHKFLQLARDINNQMPAYTVELMLQGMSEVGLDSKKTKIALLGLAYKKNIDDTRESPALIIKEILAAKHLIFDVFDPYVAKLSSVANTTQALLEAQVIMLACDHDEFVKELTPDLLHKRGIKLVVDGKNALNADGIAELGITYIGIGRSRKPIK